MLVRILAIASNTYREAVRARLLIGVFALALATCAYSLVVAALSLHNELRVVADLGAASLSLYGVVIAVLLGSTSLYRELELKTIFPILSRPVRRWEYIAGKFTGTMLTALVFVAVDAASVLAFLGLEAGERGRIGAASGVLLALLGAALWRARGARVYVLVPWALGAAVVMWTCAGHAGPDRQLVAAASVLALGEIAIVAAVATLFSSFSSPVLTAVFTTMVFVIGRSADTLARLPEKVFGSTLVALGHGLARVFPNLQVYVPARPLLLGDSVWRYVATAELHSALYAAGLLALSAIVFHRRDFA